MAPGRDEVVRDRDVLRIAVDYGSRLLKAAVQHIKAGDTASQTRKYDVMLKPGQKVVEQKIICLDNGKLLWGRSDVQKYKRDNPKETGHVVELWKLLLCPQYRETPTGRRLCRNIAGRDSYDDEAKVELEEFIAEHLREIKAATLNWLCHHHPKGLKYDMDYWQSIPIEFMITVPAMWDQEAQGLMKNAAMKAGFSDISIRYEELCAAAAECQALLESKDVEYGWKICNVDIGGGTVDVSTVQILETGIIMVGKSTGALAGSQVVNDEIEAYVIEGDQVRSLGGLEEACRRLDIDQDSFSEQVSTSVESQKAGFPDIDSMLIDVRSGPGWPNVTDENGNAVGQDGLTVRIPYDALETCFKTWVDKICAAIQQHLSQKEQDCHAAILTGGGSTNSYVREHCDQFFVKLIGRASRDNSSGKQPVCHGGLTHYPESAVHDLPEGYLYLSQNEVYDPKVHKDCTSRKRKRSGKQRPSPNDSKLIVWAEGSIDEVRLAPDRLNLFMSNVEGQITTNMIMTNWLVSAAEDAIITFDLYHSVSKLKDCGPVKDNTGNIRKELTKWPIVFSGLPELSTHGFLSYTEQGIEVYRINGYIEVSATATRLELTVVLLRPTVAFKYDKQGMPLARKGAYTEDEIVCKKTIEVFDGHRSHIVAKDALEPGAASTPSVTASTASRRQSRQRSDCIPQIDNASDDDCDDEEPLTPAHKYEHAGSAGNFPAVRQNGEPSLYDAMTLRPRRRKRARTAVHESE